MKSSEVRISLADKIANLASTIKGTDPSSLGVLAHGAVL